MATQRATAVIRPDITSRVNAAPVDEFHNNDALIVGCFPDIFLLGWFSGLHFQVIQIHACSLIAGEGVREGSGSLGAKHVSHLLMQHDNRFSTCMPLLYTLFNQLQRHVSA